MAGKRSESQATDGSLESWKAIANYLHREVRTVQRWEPDEGLPVHRHEHKKQATVYAYQHEIDEWRANRVTHGAVTRAWARRLGVAALLLLGTIAVRCCPHRFRALGGAGHREAANRRAAVRRPEPGTTDADGGRVDRGISRKTHADSFGRKYLQLFSVGTWSFTVDSTAQDWLSHLASFPNRKSTLAISRNTIVSGTTDATSDPGTPCAEEGPESADRCTTGRGHRSADMPSRHYVGNSLFPVLQ